MFGNEKSTELSRLASSELNCTKFQHEYEQCVKKYWKDKRKCDDTFKEMQLCLMRYVRPLN